MGLISLSVIACLEQRELLANPFDVEEEKKQIFYSHETKKETKTKNSFTVCREQHNSEDNYNYSNDSMLL